MVTVWPAPIEAAGSPFKANIAFRQCANDRSRPIVLKNPGVARVGGR
jgi:hypothetical protein